MFFPLGRPPSTAWRRMSHPTEEIPDPPPVADGDAVPHDPPALGAAAAPPALEVEEQTPDGGRTVAASTATPAAEAPEADAPAPPAGDDDEPPPDLVWYVLKVQSSREDTI